MTHLWAVATIHSCIRNGLRTTVVYTESKTYYPPKSQYRRVVRAWRERQYDIASKYLQSAGLGSVQILPEFSGNFGPGRPTCLILFAGYEPNRVEGLMDSYSPSAVLVVYGVSPHKGLAWRTHLSKELHRELFARWHVRETDVSTLGVDAIIQRLEEEFRPIRDQFDVAISPLCSKMQAVAAYLFWRRHPEVQLVFSSPVRFHPSHYSLASGKTFAYEVEL
jgi:hypothetical protein